ncbi:MAG: hypothetical protein IIU76_03220 [Bacteroidales bacterium]|nr:hypothetical protein [Bacteroidales bacterium]
MDKVLKFFIVIAVSVFVAGCTSKEDKAKEVASQMLDAYINHNYQAAGAMCSEQLREVFVKAHKDFEEMSNEHRDILKKETSSVEVAIESACRIGESDTVAVHYNLIKNSSDTAKCCLFVFEDKVIQLHK